MAVRPIDGAELISIERLLDTDVVRQSKTASWLLDQVLHDIQAMPTLTPQNEPLTWEELTAEIKINPVYSMKYGWIFPNTVKDEPYKQIWFFTSKGFANTELFHRDTFYHRPPEGEEGK